MPGVAAMRASAFASSASGAGSASRPLVTSTRQVVQRARPPHTAACGMPCSRSVSSTVAPGMQRNGAPARMGEQRRAAAPLDHAAHAARRERQQHQREMQRPADRRDAVGLPDHGVGHAARDLRACGAQNLVARRDVSAERERRQQQAGDRERAAPLRIGRLGAQPEMQADHRMRPHHDDRRGLNDGEPWQHQPLQREHEIIGALEARDADRDPHRRDVVDQQRRNAQAEAELPPFPARQGERAAQPDRPQGIGVMHRRRRREQREADTACAMAPSAG